MKKIHSPGFCKPARMFLRVTMPVVLVYSLGMMLSYFEAREESLLLANAVYSDFLEYLIAAALIPLCYFLLIEIAWRDGKSRKER